MVWLASPGDRPRQVQRLNDDLGAVKSPVMPSPAHRGQRVLVVDDEAEFATAASLLLVASGYEVVGQPGTAAGGLSAALALRPDVVLLDISLPDGNGFDVARQLTELENPAALIMISSRDGAGLRAGACEAGARGFLPKSKFSVSSIRALLDSIAPEERCGTH
jgi:DNA-binding NarL/FixJ family response regulator